MEWMKSDMGGAAAVIAAITAIARLGLDVNVTGWAPMAENMPSGTAQRPSDVLTIYGGTTVEVLNTDAEGRLVLADGIVRASEDKPDLHHRRGDADRRPAGGARHPHLGVMANDDALRDRDRRRRRPRPASRCGRCRCRSSCAPSMDSTVADIANMGDRYGGMLVAGLFLKEFVRRRASAGRTSTSPGPSFNDAAPHGYTPKGGTGHPVRTLVRLAEELADGALAEGLIG